MSDVAAILEVRNVSRSYALRRSNPLQRRQTLRAVDDVSLEVRAGESLGIIGESGCGKSTLARLCCGLTAPTAGQVLFDGVDLARLSSRELRSMRHKFQMVFQNPRSSLNPRKTIREQLDSVLSVNTKLKRFARQSRIEGSLDDVGLSTDHLDRLPHQLSGGQRQRVAIARAIVLRPTLLVCDEVVSALDVSVQTEILKLLRRLQERHSLAMLFITHDLGVVPYVCDRVAVMYLGRLVEISETRAVIGRTAHPYTRDLFASVPVLGSSETWLGSSVRGEPPSAIDLPSGCAYRPRCEFAEELCAVQAPELEALGERHLVACHVKVAESRAGRDSP